ncbi:MAG: hypothetical protein KBF43_15160 [Dermatophilaceae bacterium]|jgi:Holliday junction resolvase|nr:hypothetical protein [Dermatophilaceae bacterium]MBP9919921.1 hypothetical protein [Dermatophilaceae bacterium]
MSHPEVEPIEFTLNGRHYVLAKAVVEARLVGVEPRAIHEHAVLVNGEWFPSRQAFALALGLPDHLVKSRTARTKLAALGFQTRRASGGSNSDESVDRVSSAGATLVGSKAKGRAARQVRVRSDPGRPEADIQASVVTALVGAGWVIRSVANTATREHGIDIIAERDGQSVGVEVKGFPGLGYADPARADQRKRTRPSTQAGHWFSQAILAAMRLRTKHPDWRSVIALPDHARYRTLHAETVTSLSAASIDVWWVDHDGQVTGLSANESGSIGMSP